MITDTVDKLDFKAEQYKLNPFDESSKLSLKASLYTIPVNITQNSSDISIKILNDTDNEYIEVSENQAYIDEDSFHFVPLKRGETYYISASLGGVTETIKIFAEAHPFIDMSDHWASEMSYDMFNSELMIGELINEERFFFPERNMSRAEFCMVLARALGLDTKYVPEHRDDSVNNTEEVDENDALTSNISESSDAEEMDAEEVSESESQSVSEEDVYTLSDVPDWAKGSVYSLYTAGYIDSMVYEDESGVLTMDASQQITRMDVIRVLGKIVYESGFADHEEAIGETVFADYEYNNESDLIYLNSLYSSGIITGYSDGSIRQWSNLTRAEAAAVLSRFTSFVA